MNSSNKYLKYVLIVAVVGVWGAIIYRIVQGLSSSSPAPQIAPQHLLSVLSPATDSFHLNADYPDPFLAEADSIIKDTVVSSNPAPTPVRNTAPVATPPEPITSIIQLNGIIANPGSKHRIAIVTVRGKESMVREGETVDAVSIRHIGKDGITVIYKGKPYFLH